MTRKRWREREKEKHREKYECRGGDSGSTILALFCFVVIRSELEREGAKRYEEEEKKKERGAKERIGENGEMLWKGKKGRERKNLTYQKEREKLLGLQMTK